MEIVCGKATDYMDELGMNYTYILVCHDLHNPEFKIHIIYIYIYIYIYFFFLV
jgi:hypothetical protein